MNPTYTETTPWISSERKRVLASFLLVFIGITLTGKLGQYIFFNLEISPAFIWPPVGIALAAAYIGGYWMAIPIFLAQLSLTLTSPSSPSFIVGAASVLFYTIQPFLGAYILKRLDFDGKMHRTKDALALILTALFLPMFAPLFISTVQYFAGSLSVPFWVSWSRSTAGGILSVMIFTPFITAWRKFPLELFTGEKLLEVMASLSVLILSVYATFWTTLPKSNIFIILYILFATLFWIGLRLESRMMSLALFLITIIGMAGSILAHPTATPLNQQLLADELFIILIAPIFLVLASLVEEKKMIARTLSARARELEHALQKLSHEDQSKNEFIAILAHELRNPLAPILSTLELLKMEETDPDAARLIGNTIVQTNIMRRLLDDLLDAARVSQQKFTLKRETIEFRESAEHAAASVGAFFESKGHRLSVSLPTTPTFLNVDPVRFEQIIVNLLNNAGKYTEPDGRISLSAIVEGNFLVIRVKDNGIGIDPDELESIFAPFYQIRAHPRVGSGLGIGLSLTKRLVEMHGGTIDASSAGIGRGSTFTVRMPHIQIKQHVSPLRIGGLRSEKTTDQSGTWKVLVVDDNKAAAEGIAALLTHRGHSVALVHTGEQVVSAVDAFKPNVILLDIGLPDIDGYEVARRLRAAHVSAPLIALSGYGQDEHKQKARDAGFDHHLTKPSGLADIEEVFQKIKYQKVGVNVG